MKGSSSGRFQGKLTNHQGIIHGTADHEQHLHIHNGAASLAAHRHCATHDVNGDGDTDDDEDNDGTCPGPDDPDAPDLAWPPALPDLGDPWWGSVSFSV